MKYQVQIRKRNTDEVVRVLTYDSRRSAERAETAANWNLNHEEYYTDLVEVEEGEE